MTDAQKDLRQYRGECLKASLEAALTALRNALEDDGEDGPSQASSTGHATVAEALCARVQADLEELARLTGHGAPLESLAPAALLEELPLAGCPKTTRRAGNACTAALTGPGLEALQAFRRAALRDRETLEGQLTGLAATQWRSASDAKRCLESRRLALRLGAWLLGAAVALAGIWGWQHQRQATLTAQVNKVKAETARQALLLLSQAAWQATRVQNKPLAALAPDMSADCAVLNVQATLPNHPCRIAWATVRQAIFHAAIPAPSAVWNAPSEIFFDPWGGPYVVESAANPPTVRSAGPDGRLGTADDILVPVPYWAAPGGN